MPLAHAHNPFLLSLFVHTRSMMLSFIATAPTVRGATVSPWVTSRSTRVSHANPPSPRRQARFHATSQPTTESEPALRYEDDGTRVVPIPLFLRGTEDETIAGVYAVMDGERTVTYVGLSRDISKSLQTHLDRQPEELVQFVKVMTFAMPSAREMKLVVDTWIRDNDNVPQGNVEDWTESDSELAREASLIESSISDSQSIVSPFASNSVEIETPVAILDLSEENVDTVLDEVRPYLISDGGNVSVRSVDPTSGRVELQLEGACGSCSSATATMQMGIEKALRAKFGANIGEVVAVSAPELGSGDLTVEACEAVLEEVRDALKGLGATVKVLEIDDGEVIVSFNGPNNLKYGIELILREKLQEVDAVTFE